MPKSPNKPLNVPECFKEANISGKTALILSTWFGSGLFPFASGTFATLMTIPFILIFSTLGTLYWAVVLVILIGIAIWSADKTQNMLERKDPSEVVIDETAGFMLAMIFMPISWKTLCLSFFLFRFFDVLKPYPIRHLERLKGGVGIVMDDLLAGVYTYAVTWVIFFLFSGWID